MCVPTCMHNRISCGWYITSPLPYQLIMFMSCLYEHNDCGTQFTHTHTVNSATGSFNEGLYDFLSNAMWSLQLFLHKLFHLVEAWSWGIKVMKPRKTRRSQGGRIWQDMSHWDTWKVWLEQHMTWRWKSKCKTSKLAVRVNISVSAVWCWQLSKHAWSLYISHSTFKT